MDGEQSYSLESHCPSIGWFVTTKKPSIDDIPKAGKDQVGHRQVVTGWLRVGKCGFRVVTGWLRSNYTVVRGFSRDGYGVVAGWSRGVFWWLRVTGWLRKSFRVVRGWLWGGYRVLTGWIRVG